MHVEIETIPHAEQRYDTVGDWQLVDYGRAFRIRVSNLGSWQYEFLVALHELVEAALCKQHGVSEAEVDAFDQHYAGECTEPGDDLRSPYWLAHAIASGIERTVAAAMHVNWPEYDRRIAALTQETPCPKAPESTAATPS